MPGGLETTPRDELTGQPLSLLTKPEDFHAEGLDCTPEFHHQLHPGNDTELGCDDRGKILPAADPRRSEGLAVRYSKGQVVPNWLHDHYHDLFFGPKLPVDSADKHTTVLLGLAKVVPRRAIEIHEPGTYRIVNLNRTEHDFIRRTTFHEGAGRGWEQNRRGRIGSYLAKYALQNFLPEIIDDREMSLNIEQFFCLDEQLSNPRELRWDEDEFEVMKGQPTLKQLARRQMHQVGNMIVSQAIEASAEPSRQLYEQSIREGMVQGTKRGLGQIAVKFFGQGRFPGFSETLKDYIAAAQNGYQVVGIEESDAIPVAA